MKTTFKLGKMAMKAEVNEHGDLGGIAFEMSDIEQDVEISKEEIPELVKSLVANAKETRETIKVLRHEVTLFVKDIKAIIDGDDVAPGTTITRTVDGSSLYNGLASLSNLSSTLISRLVEEDDDNETTMAEEEENFELKFD